LAHAVLQAGSSVPDGDLRRRHLDHADRVGNQTTAAVRVGQGHRQRISEDGVGRGQVGPIVALIFERSRIGAGLQPLIDHRGHSLRTAGDRIGGVQTPAGSPIPRSRDLVSCARRQSREPPLNRVLAANCAAQIPGVGIVDGFTVQVDPLALERNVRIAVVQDQRGDSPVDEIDVGDRGLGREIDRLRPAGRIVRQVVIGHQLAERVDAARDVGDHIVAAGVRDVVGLAQVEGAVFFVHVQVDGHAGQRGRRHAGVPLLAGDHGHGRRVAVGVVVHRSALAVRAVPLAGVRAAAARRRRTGRVDQRAVGTRQARVDHLRRVFRALPVIGRGGTVGDRDGTAHRHRAHQDGDRVAGQAAGVGAGRAPRQCDRNAGRVQHQAARQHIFQPHVKRRGRPRVRVRHLIRHHVADERDRRLGHVVDPRLDHVHRGGERARQFVLEAGRCVQGGDHKAVGQRVALIVLGRVQHQGVVLDRHELDVVVVRIVVLHVAQAERDDLAGLRNPARRQHKRGRNGVVVGARQVLGNRHVHVRHKGDGDAAQVEQLHPRRQRIDQLQVPDRALQHLDLQPVADDLADRHIGARRVGLRGGHDGLGRIQRRRLGRRRDDHVGRVL